MIYLYLNTYTSAATVRAYINHVMFGEGRKSIKGHDMEHEGKSICHYIMYFFFSIFF